MQRRKISEATHTVQATQAEAGSGRWVIQLIEAGWGASGYYPADVLERDGPGIFSQGTHMYLNHPTATEEYERPEGDVLNLAAVLVEDARWDKALQGLVAEAQVFESFRPALEERAAHIGVSIRAYAEAREGEREGRRGDIVTRLVEGVSVDFVTHAGAGGRILEMVESARRHPHLEASARKLEEQIGDRLRVAYGAEASVWVRDFDPATTAAYYHRETESGGGTYQHSYTVDSAGAVQLEGSPTEVRVETTYVPVEPAADDSTTSTNPTESRGGPTMAEIADTELAQLREAAGQAQASAARADAAELREATTRATVTAITHARTRVREANGTLPAAVVDRIVSVATATVPLTESRTIDTAALDSAVDVARLAEETYFAALAEARGAGTVTDAGQTVEQQEVTVEESSAAIAAAFGRKPAKAVATTTTTTTSQEG